MSTIRQEQIQRRLVEEISDMVQRDLKDPRLGFVTITGAEISRDLRNAKVFVSVLGTEEQQRESVDVLRRASSRIRGEFTRRAGLRVAPEIDFRNDSSVALSARIHELLKTVEADLKPDATEPETGSAGDTSRA